MKTIKTKPSQAKPIQKMKVDLKKILRDRSVCQCYDFTMSFVMAHIEAVEQFALRKRKFKPQNKHTHTKIHIDFLFLNTFIL